MTNKISLSTDEEYFQIQSELSARKKPAKTLRVMMQALENYRQSKKMGWSRAWNKYNVVNFQSFKLNAADLELRRMALEVIETEATAMPSEARHFVSELLGGNQIPMGYLFFQEYTENGRLFEGAVVSFGRVSKISKRFRDRMDLILESEVIDGSSQGLTRLRIYVDPYTGNKDPLWQSTLENPKNDVTHFLFQSLADLSWAWAHNKSRIWDHWITDYIDYFGPRKWPMRKSYFHCAEGSSRRIQPDLVPASYSDTQAA